MRRIVTLPTVAYWLRSAVLGICVIALTGCAATRQAWFSPVHPESELERNRFQVAPGTDVIGRLGLVKLEEGDTLPDVARHFSVGINAISAANPGVDVWLPKAGQRITLPLNFILPDAPRKGIVINLATMRLFQFKENGGALAVSTYPVGIGTKERPTPQGPTRVARKASRPTWYVPASIAEDHRKKGDILPARVPPGPENPLGDYALYLSRSGYLIHGTNKPASIGLKASNGCMRLYPEHIEVLFRDTAVNTPVLIVNQPYLIGQRDGVLYMEAHTPLEDSGTSELARIHAKLKSFESASARTLDWDKIKQVQAEARGIPVPILELRPGAEQEAASPLRIEHPAALYGRPELPALKLDAWYVMVGDMRDEMEARRMAAIINHQGPPIPARVLSKDSSYRIIAGPFSDDGKARDAAKRLKIDLDIDGIVIEPGRTI
ncbi:L,D-transpeptidase family protein [Geobacter sulfurreducens]|jgi:L,D-transpeptidase ErfK/SrfK|uniref:Peptidoglycan L,D-transpeptidase lipoprotein, YkuD family, SPOR domain-containing n=1 Tax=Geobacter sulfurreducens (strain ATCC 51573 / DSM 12127 / PCA) TaxID=243231 RepID=Q74GR2_GEOSL|nr:L,D-transpeptidase family protein [Geobacter sulfurreducens]BET60024.1 L,D-transpeptidase family protein [Geobacter sp. 60473]AAR33518.1 peptidoglycan L,D-transpeptidase lipoprotein, YkuD family, SPOR domain-containing [Geobacter sulfurreducens PCA]ADI83020.1 peptidoglycan L,D-transpeptidase lipoprotein, YkuD family, SPOR domain-containing [Geobacter sulfurreducens KN400]QVW35461.1 L,D-transpeptidase family protein [Geobacter sulfurreducens]UAC04283.1 L,D-transpeptidase family protein [Geob